MVIYALEYLFYIVHILAILVAVSLAILFSVSFRAEKKLRTVWRIAGFVALALAFIVYIIERRYLGSYGLAIAGLELEFLGWFMIFQGVRAEPLLSQLSHDGTTPVDKQAPKVNEKKLVTNWYTLVPVVITLILIIAIFLPISVPLVPFLPTLLVIASVIYIASTLPLQNRRYQLQKDDKEARSQNIYPLFAYAFLLFRAIPLAFYRFPESNIVFLRSLSFEYSTAWITAIVLFAFGFLLLGIWAWNFIKIRKTLRIYVVFLIIVAVVASLAALIFTSLIFQTVRSNNLELMEQATDTQGIIMTERSDISAFVANIIASDSQIGRFVQTSNFRDLGTSMEYYFSQSGVDTLRVYNRYGEVVVSPSDPRDQGRVFSDDSLLAFALLGKQQVKSFDTQPGVLTPVIVSRAIVPILDQQETVIGAVEVDHVFDNAFVDFAKKNNGLDVTIFTKSKRSANTIISLDNVSRWVGTEETNQQIITQVLNEGRTVQVQTEQLGVNYYSAYAPIRNSNGTVIGMISVGTPIVKLIEETRQQVVTTFLIVSLLSLLASVIGYLSLYYTNHPEREQFVR